MKYLNDYDWERRTKQPRVAILPDARVLTEAQTHSLRSFVEHGNTLLITGLTGFYGPHATAWQLNGFPLEEITGGQLKEVHLRGKAPLVSLSAPSGTFLPSRCWISSIDPSSASAIGQQVGDVIATERNFTDGGRVIWIPSPIVWVHGSRMLTR